MSDSCQNNLRSTSASRSLVCLCACVLWRFSFAISSSVGMYLIFFIRLRVNWLEEISVFCDCVGAVMQQVVAVGVVPMEKGVELYVIETQSVKITWRLRNLRIACPKRDTKRTFVTKSRHTESAIWKADREFPFTTGIVTQLMSTLVFNQDNVFKTSRDLRKQIFFIWFLFDLQSNVDLSNPISTSAVKRRV